MGCRGRSEGDAVGSGSSIGEAGPAGKAGAGSRAGSWVASSDFTVGRTIAAMVGCGGSGKECALVAALCATPISPVAKAREAAKQAAGRIRTSRKCR
jgi:hypothetical protein